MSEYLLTAGGSVFIGYGLANYDYITIAAGITMILTIIIQKQFWKEN